MKVQVISKVKLDKQRNKMDCGSIFFDSSGILDSSWLSKSTFREETTHNELRLLTKLCILQVLFRKTSFLGFSDISTAFHIFIDMEHVFSKLECKLLSFIF